MSPPSPASRQTSTSANVSVLDLFPASFGPVLVVTKFSTEAEAIELANSSTFGLGAALFTNDAKQSARVPALIEAGTVWVNQYAILHSSVPFGGFKMSGIGRELGAAGVEEYTRKRDWGGVASRERSHPIQPRRSEGFG